jgi:Na+-transporting NADH:ubiquinone oxidoreductase subunit F
MTMTRVLLTIHKWVGVCLGILVLIWLVSGIVLILPDREIIPRAFNSPGDLSTAEVSPASAAARVSSDSTAPRSVRLVGIGGRPYYQVTAEQDQKLLVDASSGQALNITAQVAESLARLAVGAKVASVEEIRGQRQGSSSGPPLAFLVTFDDRQRTTARVSLSDGSVRAETKLRRVRREIAELHTLQQLQTISGSKVLREAVLHVTSIIGIFLVLTGYYLSLPKSWRRRIETRAMSGD